MTKIQIYSLLFGLSFSLDNFLFKNLPPGPWTSLRASSVISVLILIFNFKNINFKSSEFKGLLLLCISGTAVATLMYGLFYSKDFIFFPIIRQSLSFVLGISTFLALQYVISSMEDRTFFFRTIIWGSIPSLIFGIIQYLQEHRYDGNLRVISFFKEPSYFGDYLTTILLPALLAIFLKFNKQTYREKVFLIGVLTLVFFNIYIAQSGTALLNLAAFLFFCCIFLPIPRKMKISGSISIISATMVAGYISKGYVAWLIGYFFDMIQDTSLFFRNITFSDRFYPIYKTLSLLLNPKHWLGSGFGADYFQHKSLFPEFMLEAILRMRADTFVFLNSLGSKYILYFGLPGLFLIYLWIKKLKNLTPIEKIGLATVGQLSLWGIGNFSYPYIWIWFTLASCAIQELKENN